MKKLFTLFLALAASVTIHAAIVNGTCGANLTWTLNTKDSTLTIEGSGAMTNWAYNQSASWSEYNSYIKTVSLPDGLTSIGNWAFYGCSKLTSVTIPNSVTSIGDEAFGECSCLTSVTIGNSVTSIGEYAFYWCSALTSVTIPNSVTSIGDYAFHMCSALTSVTIPNSVTSIGKWAFRDCSGLTSVTIPNSVTRIGSEAFKGCPISEIYYSGTIEQWCSKSWSPGQISGNYTLYIDNNKVSDLVIPNSVTSIGNYAFYNCIGLKSVSFGSNLTSIGDYAFGFCNLLSPITCEAVVPPTISSNTFSNKSSLLFVPEESIEAYQNALYWEDFTNIRAIGSAPLVQFVDWDGTVLSSANVTIGTAATPPADPTREGYTFIGWDKDFTNVTEYLVVTAQYKINRYYVQFLDWDNAVLKADSIDWNTAAVAPADPIRVGYSFIGWDKDFSNITEDLIVTAQYKINRYYVQFLDWDNSVLKADSVDWNTAATAPANPTREGYTFIGWDKDFSNVTEDLVVTAQYEMGENTNFTVVFVNGTCGDNLTWSFNTKDSTLTISGTGEMTSSPWYEYRAYIKTVSLPDGLTSIGSDAFSYCRGLTSVTIPNSVTSIGGYAFLNCSSLTSVTIGNSVTSIGYRAFDGCSGLTSVTIPNSVTRIGDWAFWGCSGLTSVTIGNSVTRIGDWAFWGCFGLTSVTIGNSITSIGSGAFSRCSINRLTVYATTPPTGGAGCGINNGTCTLYVPAESIETYANAAWWEDFANIRPIGSSLMVKFVDWDGKTLSFSYVESGEDAVAPADPTREGYTFIGWDKDFSNITEDLVVTAQYKINRYYVQFLDWDNSVLKADSIDWNTAATAPADPTREGYTFIGWDKDFSNVTEDLVVTAQYERGENTNFTIVFVNGNDESDIFAHDVVLKVPAAPEIDGFTFLGWRPVAEFIESNTIEIEAVYEADEQTAAPAVYTNPANSAQKLIRNGSVYILTEDKTYTITGQEMK